MIQHPTAPRPDKELGIEVELNWLKYEVSYWAQFENDPWNALMLQGQAKLLDYRKRIVEIDIEIERDKISSVTSTGSGNKPYVKPGLY